MLNLRKDKIKGATKPISLMTPSKLYYPLDVLPRLSIFILIGINPRFA